MPVTRNPFRLRASEQATSDELFLSLFSSRVIDLLPADAIWDRLVLITSAPGGGKSTLLRLFTPRILSRVARASSTAEFQELAERLRSVGAITETPRVAGVLVNCDEQYASIEDLPYDPSVRAKLFFSLLDARVTLLTLREIAQVANLDYPGGTAQIVFVPKDEVATTAPTLSGEVVHQQAQDAEAEITRLLNSLVTIHMPDSGKRSLDFLRLLSTHNIRANERTVEVRPLVMFDDAHRLTSHQRSILRADLQDKELRVSRWMAMRLEALQGDELIGEARTVGREYTQVRIEDWWNRAHHQFATWLGDIANRRAKRAEVDLSGFDSCLMSSLTTADERSRAKRALLAEKDAARSLTSSHGAFSSWKDVVDEAIKEDVDQAVRWRALTFLMERRLAKQLPLGIPLPSEEANQINESDERKAAALFLSKDYKLPYYFGTGAIAQLGSSNVEQYLFVAAKLFDRFLASGVGRARPTQLTASQQDAIVRQASQEKLDSIPRDMPHGRDMYRLVEGIGRLCADLTFRKQASYAPGVTAIAISMEDRETLARIASDPLGDQLVRRIYDVITAAIAHNILEPKLNHKTKGRKWMVLHLNRLLCPAFQLPLDRSNHREVTLKQIAGWIANGDAQTRLAV